MTILTCKMCGGKIQITGKSHGQCDSCGCEVTLPKIDDDKRANMYNRGNHFREAGEFDRAYSAYEHIIADDQGDAEAHWCLTLCRYGVTYVKDYRTGDYKPTVSRMRYEPILDDPDYLAALAASDEYTKELYRREARKIEVIQKRYLEIMRQEAPYDVFISFKAEKKGLKERTRASEIGQELYEKLTEKGVKVFFSRITLEDKLAIEYEPYIFAALHSAKVMVLVADEAWQLQERWVKNEWTRYLSMMDTDSNKHILPVFEGMSPYEFPQEIPMVQGVDMTKIGAMQDLVRGIMKITGHLTAQGTVVTGGTQVVSASNLLRRAEQAREDGEFAEAEKLLEQVLNRDPENGEAYYNCFLAKQRMCDLPTKAESGQSALLEDRFFRRALQYGSEARKAELNEFARICMEKDCLDEAERCNKSGKYEAALQILDEVEKNAKAQGCKVSNPELVSSLYESIRKNIEIKRQKDEANRELQAKIKAYREEIDPVRTYITRRIQKENPNVAKKYKSMKDTESKIVESTYDEGIGLIGLVFAFLMVALALAIPANEGSTIIPWFVCGCIAGSIIFLDEFIGVWPTIIISVICTVVISFIMQDASDSMLMILMIITGILSAITFVRGIIRTVNTIRWNALYDMTANYAKKTVRPLEEKIRKEVHDRWAPEIGEKNLVHLPGLED